MTPNPGHDEVPALNIMIEDYLARGASELEHALLLQAWLMLGVEYLARAAGRQHTVHRLEVLRKFVSTATPTTPWKP